MGDDPELDQEHVLYAKIDHNGQLRCPRCRSGYLNGNPAYPHTEKIELWETTSPAGAQGPWQRLYFQCTVCRLYFALFIGCTPHGFVFQVIPVAGQGFGKDAVFTPQTIKEK